MRACAMQPAFLLCVFEVAYMYNFIYELIKIGFFYIQYGILFHSLKMFKIFISSLY